MSTTVELHRVKAELAALRESIRTTVDDLLLAMALSAYQFDRVHVTADLNYIRGLVTDAGA